MAQVIQSAGELATIANPGGGLFGSTRIGSSIKLYNQRTASYADIVRSQPNVRTVISFIARNIAQLGVHLFERVSDTDRRRVRDHAFAEAIREPNPADRHLTTYRLIHRTLWNLGAYDVAVWAILPVDGLGRPVIVPLPADRVEVIGHLWPTLFRYHGERGTRDFTPDQIVYFQASTDLLNPNTGLSPIETLRRNIAEDTSAAEYREQFWRSGARVSAVIERPVDAPEWSVAARDRFSDDLDALYTGEGPKAGGVPILEDGMEWKEAGSMDARRSQYIEARRLSREEAAALYHIQPLWVGVSGAGESFASVKERHRALYQDDLGPWVTMLEQDLIAQALPAFEASADTRRRYYIKLNVAEKLRGAPDDVADSINKLVGRPVLTPNEGRALLDRNDIEGGDSLTIPLNVAIGGQTIPGEAPPGSTPRGSSAGPSGKAALPARAKAGLTQPQLEALATANIAVIRQVLERTFERQRLEVNAELGAGTTSIEALFDRDRWDSELGADLFGANLEVAGAVYSAMSEALDFSADPDELLEYLSQTATIAAENINFTTARQLADALEADEPTDAVGNVFAIAATTRAAQAAQSRWTATANVAAKDAARQAGYARKVWNVTSSQSRHPELSGATAPLGEPFPNGMQYPGDPAGGVDAVAGCTCYLTFTVTE